jgi:endo-1,4-beta-xylanase
MTSKSVGSSAAAERAGTAADPYQSSTAAAVSRRLLLGGAAALTVTGLGAPASAFGAATASHSGGHPAHRHAPLWRVAAQRGITFGSAASVRVYADADYGALLDREAAILFTEEDLLWYELKPDPDAPLDFSFADEVYARARRQGQLVFGAHLVWDEGFGDGWEDFDFSSLTSTEAATLLFGTERAIVDRYRGRTAGWIVANEVTSPEGVQGFRTDVPWYGPLGPGYVAKAFRIARRHDRHATLVLNEYGFETVNQYGDQPVDRQQATLQVIDSLQADGVPLDALGIQAHLLAEDFAGRFDAHQYRHFLRSVARRGLKILITELDVLDDGLPADVAARDAAVADIYARYLEVALAEPAVKSVMAFGLSDRYTWLQED